MTNLKILSQTSNNFLRFFSFCISYLSSPYYISSYENSSNKRQSTLYSPQPPYFDYHELNIVAACVKYMIPRNFRGQTTMDCLATFINWQSSVSSVQSLIGYLLHMQLSCDYYGLAQIDLSCDNTQVLTRTIDDPATRGANPT